jgi:hypothetical protein
MAEGGIVTRVGELQGTPAFPPARRCALKAEHRHQGWYFPEPDLSPSIEDARLQNARGSG